MRRRATAAAHVFTCAVLIASALSSCKRETCDFQAERLTADTPKAQYQVTIEKHNGRQVARVTNWYEQNAYALSRGKELYSSLNCVGCHAHGGGGMGPALTDANWTYGSDPGELYGSIMYGRPNGMPAFHEKMQEEEAWELAAYVRSLAGLTPKQAAPGRSDEMHAPPPPATKPEQTPKDSIVADHRPD